MVEIGCHGNVQPNQEHNDVVEMDMDDFLQDDVAYEASSQGTISDLQSTGSTALGRSHVALAESGNPPQMSNEATLAIEKYF